MKLKQLGPNQTEVEVDGNRVLFSYETPVAVKFANGDAWRTAKKWSRTTTRHINRWLNETLTLEVSQEAIEVLVPW
jgi:hypothetical protein